MRNLLRTVGQKILPAHTAVVIVDVQNDMCSPNGSFARLGIDVSPLSSVVPRIAALAEAAQGAGILTTYTQTRDSRLPFISDAYYEANLAFYELHNHGLDDSGLPTWDSTPWGEEFCPPVKPRPEDPIIVKHRFGAFANTRLDQLLRSNNVKTVVLAGVLTDVCVESTARAAIDHDYYVVVAADCTATLDEDRQRASLRVMGEIIGEVSDLRTIEGLWSGTSYPGDQPKGRGMSTGNPA